jgi:hypothetical protein
VLVFERSVEEAAVTVTEEPALSVVPLIVPRRPVRRLVPMLVVAVGFPLASKAKMLLAAPLMRFQPIVVEATSCPALLPERMEEAGTERRFEPIVVVETTLPLLSTPRSALASEVSQVGPELVNCVVLAPPFKNVVPVKVEELCEMRPLPKVCSAVQMLAEARSWALETRQVPPIATQPEARLRPVP